MRAVWRYSFRVPEERTLSDDRSRLVVSIRSAGDFALYVPVGASVKSVSADGRDIVAWIEVDPDERRQGRISFHYAGTGRHFHNGYRYVGTVAISGVHFHVYALPTVDLEEKKEGIA